MSDQDDDIDLEREKTKSFELGHVSQLEDVAEDLRERAGEVYAQADNHRAVKRAKQLKRLAQDYEEQAQEKRAEWEDTYQ